jgi:hypothetical protein
MSASEQLVEDGTVGVSEGVRITSLSLAKIDTLMETGRLAYTRVDGRRLIPRKAIRALLSQNLVAAN